MHPSFEQVPAMLYEVQQQVQSIQLLLSKDVAENNTNDLLGVEQAAQLLGLSPATLYSKASRKELPYSKAGKKLYFSRKELLEYVRSGRRLTKAEESLQVLKNSANAMKGVDK